MTIVCPPISTAQYKNPVSNKRRRFHKKVAVLTGYERILFLTLKLYFPNHRICPQFAMSQLIQVIGGSHGLYQNQWRGVCQKVLDFLIVDKNFKPRLAIELDDWRHQQDKRKAADAKKDQALKEAGIPIVRIPVKDIIYNQSRFDYWKKQLQSTILKEPVSTR